VYLGVPVDIDAVYLADGSLHTPGPTPHGVYDLKRRWFSEVVALDKPLVEIVHVAGDNNTSFTQGAIDLSPFYAAQSRGHRYLRLVFRVKTNRNFDDLTGSNSGTYSSGGEGAVRIDNVSITGIGIAGGAYGNSGFEDPAEINNSDGTDPGHALGAWRATGKP